MLSTTNAFSKASALHRQKPQKRKFKQKAMGTAFCEIEKNIKDLPDFWHDRIKKLDVYTQRHCGTVNGTIVEVYKNVSLIFIENSIGELGVIFRQLVGGIYSTLKVGARVCVHRCVIRNRVPRLIECAINSIAQIDFPYTELDEFGFFTVFANFELYEVRFDRHKIAISTGQYGRVLVTMESELYPFLHTYKWTSTTVISGRIRYALNPFFGFICFFEFVGSFKIEKTF